MPMSAPVVPSSRLASIDLLRGSVMLLMLLDHVRETFYLHQQVSDPMDAATVAPALYLSRMLAHLCAPVFVLLTGLSAWLYGQRQPDPRRAAAAFLAKRGLFLVLLELTLVNFAWNFELPPRTLYLQVIWAIGLSMLALSVLLWLPRPALALLGVVLVAGHNLLDGVRVQGDGALAVLWKVLHQRDWIVLAEGLRARTSYPVLPWIGVIALGYVLGPWYGGLAPQARQRRLLGAGAAALAAFALLRAWNGYGDHPWSALADPLRSAMGFFNVTKYPPSLLFLLLTLGIALLLLRAFEWPPLQRQRWLALFGAAPMFFYLLHLYVLRLLQSGARALWGANHGDSYGFDGIPALWLCTLLLALALYWPVRAFAQLKARRRDLAWLRYL
ncbi:MAG: heparan-alpha-glucosaminide N-acetyltransferase domain-containing protein [Pseudomonas sp.]